MLFQRVLSICSRSYGGATPQANVEENIAIYSAKITVVELKKHLKGRLKHAESDSEVCFKISVQFFEL